MSNILHGLIAAQPMSLNADAALPPGRDFLTSAGFAGAATLLAALILTVALLVIARNNRHHHAHDLEELTHHHDGIRDEQRRSDALTRAWQRLQWVVDTAGLEPASSQGITLGLGPELAGEVLRGILADADRLGDDALGNAATVHLSQLSLVLAHQAGPLPTSTSTSGATKPAAAGKDTTATPAGPETAPEASAPTNSDMATPPADTPVPAATRSRRRN